MDDKRFKAMCQRLAKVVALNLRSARAAAQMTQKQMAEKMKCLVPVISRLESARSIPSLTTLVRAADALGVPVHTLLEEPK